MSIVSTEWLSKNHSNVKVIDSSWHMPNSGRNGFQEYNKEHIEDSIFFDIDKNSNKKNKLPHMLPEHQEWNKIVSNYGISNSDKIVIYDNSDVLSSFVDSKYLLGSILDFLACNNFKLKSL